MLAEKEERRKRKRSESEDEDYKPSKDEEKDNKDDEDKFSALSGTGPRSSKKKSAPEEGRVQNLLSN